MGGVGGQRVFQVEEAQGSWYDIKGKPWYPLGAINMSFRPESYSTLDRVKDETGGIPEATMEAPLLCCTRYVTWSHLSKSKQRSDMVRFVF